MKDLFELRKKNKIPPFFTIIEEAHNYCPERSFGETRCSKILRTVASEGRKFGLGLCVISQRPARVDKSVLSQCTTQIIMKVTNPNDLKAISNSVEGITGESQEEVKNLPIGTAMITGIVDMPLFVNIRPRMTKHGGQAAEILETVKEDQFFEKLEEFNEEELLPLIRPKVTPKELKLMSDKEIQSINNILVPGYLFVCQGKTSEYNILIDLVEGEVVTNVDNFETKRPPELDKLNPDEIRLLHTAFQMKSFSKEDLVKKGLPLDIKQELSGLMKKGFISLDGGKYSISDRYILSQLSNHACYNKIEFIKVNYNHKETPRKTIDELKEKLSRFAAIKDQRECHILKYEIIYK